ncbi:MAG: hypothetical protein ACOX9E_07230, partial [Lentisphaeria bacterium]
FGGPPIFYPQISQILADYFQGGLLGAGRACLFVLPIRRFWRPAHFLSADFADSRRLFSGWAAWCREGLPVCPSYSQILAACPFSIRRFRRFSQSGGGLLRPMIRPIRPIRKQDPPDPSDPSDPSADQTDQKVGPARST